MQRRSLVSPRRRLETRPRRSKLAMVGIVHCPGEKEVCRDIPVHLPRFAHRRCTTASFTGASLTSMVISYLSCLLVYFSSVPVISFL